MEGATHVAWISVFLEGAWRTHKCYDVLTGSRYSIKSFSAGPVYFGAYVLCIFAVYLNLKRYSFFSSPFLRNFLSFLHALDGIVALVLSLAYFYKSQGLLYMGILGITKCFLLHQLSRMVTGQLAYGPAEISLQTTKTFLHHTGSFLFLGDDTTAFITGCWRFVSMNGHAAMTLRKSLSEKTYNKVMWMITHARNAILAIVILICFFSRDIRRGFGEFFCFLSQIAVWVCDDCLFLPLLITDPRYLFTSALSATGHISYMIVRLGPVFRIGSMYLDSAEEKKRWSDNTDMERFRILMSGKYPWFSLELGLLAFACVYFAYLRLTTFGIVEEFSCRII